MQPYHTAASGAYNSPKNESLGGTVWNRNGVGCQILKTSASLDIGSMSWAFCLADIEGFNTWTGLYDQYRIKAVKLKFFPYQFNSATPSASSTIGSNLATGMDYATATSTQLGAILHWYTDEDNVAGPAITSEDTLELFLKNPEVKHRRMFGKPFSIMLRPTPCGQLYDNATANVLRTGYTIGSRKSWIDCNYNMVPHYGLHMALEANGATTGAGVTLRCIATYYVQFRERQKHTGAETATPETYTIDQTADGNPETGMDEKDAPPAPP